MKKYYKEICLGALLLLTYLPAFLWMWERWFAKDSYYSHGILIPLVSGYLIWQQKEQLAKIPKSRSPWGMLLIVLGMALYLLSSLFRVYFSAGFSFLLVLVGLILHLYGWRILRAIWFPVFFLVFMVPLPMVVITNISFKMKLFAAQISEIVLNNMGLKAERQGSIIYLQHTQVVVEDVCSGLRSLISLGALGSIFAYWLKAPRWKRVFLFLTTIPIAVITNVCRVVFLSAVSEIWGAQHAGGFIHDASGFAVFALAFVLLLGMSKLIE